MRIRTATKDDIPAAAAIAAAAYIDDKQDAFMFPGRFKHPQRYLKTKESIIRHGMKDETSTTFIAELEEGDEAWSGQAEIVGFCIWYRDEVDDENEAEEFGAGKRTMLDRVKASLSATYDYARDLFDPLVSARNASIMADTCSLPSSKHMMVPAATEGPHYGIMDIAVDPKFQGRGVARMLVQWGLDKAKGERISVELCATPAGSALYEKMGFQKFGV